MGNLFFDEKPRPPKPICPFKVGDVIVFRNNNHYWDGTVGEIRRATACSAVDYCVPESEPTFLLDVLLTKPCRSCPARAGEVRVFGAWQVELVGESNG